MACATLFADGKCINTVFAVWENTHVYFEYLLPFLPLGLGAWLPPRPENKRILRYTLGKDRSRLTFNQVIQKIIDEFGQYSPGTTIGFSWNVYYDLYKPLSQVENNAPDDCKKIALIAVAGLRDFYTCSIMTPDERGGEDIDNVLM
jgi:hypothetical protein